MNLPRVAHSSNEDHPENRLDYLNLVFVRLPRFLKSIDECETLQDRLLYSLCHAHEYNEQPERLRGNVFDRLFTVIKISNFTQMEQDDYIRRAMFRADLREQLRYAKDEGRDQGRNARDEEILDLIGRGYTSADIKKFLQK